VLCCALFRQSYPTAGGNSVVQHREQQSYLGKDQPWPQLATAAMTAMVVSLDLIELAREVRETVALPSNTLSHIVRFLDAAAAVGAKLQLGPDQLRSVYQRFGGFPLVRHVCKCVCLLQHGYNCILPRYRYAYCFNENHHLRLQLQQRGFMSKVGPSLYCCLYCRSFILL
jgi:hypothetical protein